MDETTKTKRIWGPLELSILQGDGIDIGCGPDPLNAGVRRFDFDDGDANEISKFVDQQFDYVYSSHCLEHMHNAFNASLEWWKLVKPGGHLFFIVPDEDLYEQGIFPSRFNPDHKATFTISKSKSWSPVSVNVLDLATALPDSELVSIKLQDLGYERTLYKHGNTNKPGSFVSYLLKKSKSFHRRGWPEAKKFNDWVLRKYAVDQTKDFDALAQIQCIVKKAC